MHSETCVFWAIWDQTYTRKYTDYQGALIFQIGLYDKSIKYHFLIFKIGLYDKSIKYHLGS